MSHTDRGELAPHMQDHGDEQDKRRNMCDAGCRLEDDGICEFDIASIAPGLDACTIRADGRAWWDGCLTAYRIEVAETHRSLFSVIRTLYTNLSVVCCMFHLTDTIILGFRRATSRRAGSR